VKKSIQARLVITSISLAAIPLLLVGLLQNWQSTVIHIHEAVDLQHEVAVGAAAQTGAYIGELESELRVMSRLEDLPGAAYARQQDILSRLQSYRGVYDELALLDGRGQELARASRHVRVTASDLVDRSHADEFLVPAASSRTYYGPVTFDAETGEPLMVLAVPIVGARSGSVEGVLTTNIRLKAIWDLIAGIQMERGDLSYIVDWQGRVIAHPNPSVVLRGTQFSLPEQGGLHTGLAGDRVILSMAKIPLGDRTLTVVAEEPTTEALSHTGALRNVLVTVATVVILVVSLLSVYFARNITRPVQQLVRGTEEIGRGNLGYRTEVESTDEIGHLARSFNTMAVALQCSLEETAHNQRLLLALSEAAQTVQRARTPAKIFATVGEEVTRLGFHAVVFRLVDDRRQLAVAHLTFDETTQQRMGAMTGLVMRNLRVDIRPGSAYDQVIYGGQTLFVESLLSPLLGSGFRFTRRLADQVVSALGVRQGICAPLSVGGEPDGILVVIGTDLGMADMAAVTAFANQTAIALESARLYQEIQQHAEGLERRVAERTAELDRARIAAVRTMEDANAARRQAERANKELLTEVAERERAEQALQESQRMLSMLMGNLPGMAYRCRNDRQWTMEFISEGCLALTGYPPADLVGNARLSYTQVIHPDDREAVWDSVQTALRARNPFQIVYRILSVTGEEKWVWERGAGVTFANGQPLFLEGFVSDITERKRAKDKLAEYAERLEEMVEDRTQELRDAQERLLRREKLAVLGQLAGGVAHELRNPLGVIKNTAYLLRLVLTEQQEVREMLDVMEDHVAICDGIICSLLDFARTGSPSWKEVDLVEVVRRSIDQVVIPEDVQLICELDPAMPAVLADPAQLAQVMRNIVHNGVQAMPDGGQLLVKATAVRTAPAETESPRWVMVSVADTGIGIPKENLAEIFDPLVSTKDGGIGLGLALVRILVERHGGMIEVHSEVGQGSVFVIRLPLDREAVE
jgi:PAS domain S-box-containing protein